METSSACTLQSGYLRTQSDECWVQPHTGILCATVSLRNHIPHCGGADCVLKSTAKNGAPINSPITSWPKNLQVSVVSHYQFIQSAVESTSCRSTPPPLPGGRWFIRLKITPYARTRRGTRMRSGIKGGKEYPDFII